MSPGRRQMKICSLCPATRKILNTVYPIAKPRTPRVFYKILSYRDLDSAARDEVPARGVLLLRSSLYS